MTFGMAEINVDPSTRQTQHRLDYSKLVREIFVQLRDGRSQVELSQRLGYSFNQMGKWESGAVSIHWNDFIHLNEVLSIPWQEIYDSVFAFHADMSISNAPVFETLSRFFGYANLVEMANLLNKSRSSVSRLLHNQVKIQFADVLQVMDLRPFVLGSWLGKFLKPEALETFAAKYGYEIQAFKGLLSLPWAGIVNACLHLDSYRSLPKHSNEWIAGRTGLTLDQVEEAIRHLSAIGVAYLADMKYISTVHELTLLRVPEFRKVIQFVSQWTTQTYVEERSRVPDLGNPSVSSVRIYPLSAAGGKAMVDALVVFHHQLAEIVKKDKGPKDHVRCLLMHCLDMGIAANFSGKEKS